jgi:hypothetical protein
MDIRIVYETWKENGMCSTIRLTSHLLKKGYIVTEAFVAQKLAQAQVAHASGMLYPGTKNHVDPSMKIREFIPRKEDYSRNRK